MDIYLPEEDSYILEEEVRKYAKGSVLDIGTGSGIQAFAAAMKKEVRSVLAVDVNPDAVRYVKEEIKRFGSGEKNRAQKNSANHGSPLSRVGGWGPEGGNSLRKITVKKSDLFSNIPKKAKFDTIIFNPPYLPRDRRETGGIRLANSGGKHGYELLVRFLDEAGEHLKRDGNILIVFSSMTNENKIEEAISRNLLVSRKLAEKPLFMERLIVLSIEKEGVRKMLERKGVNEISFLGQGKRGVVFSGRYRGKKVAIKVKKEGSFAQGTIEKEAYWLKKLAGRRFAPKLYFHDDSALVRELVEGELILDFLARARKEEIRIVLRRIIADLHYLDSRKFNKEEMHHPLKHIMVKGSVARFIDFERMHGSEEPKNITQFLIFLSGKKVVGILDQKGFAIRRDEFIRLAREYREKRIGIRNILRSL